MRQRPGIITPAFAAKAVERSLYLLVALICCGLIVAVIGPGVWTAINRAFGGIL